MPGSNMTGTDMAQTEGPNASLDFGKATQEKALVREGGGFATGGSPVQGGAPQGGATSPPPPGAGQQQPGPPPLNPRQQPDVRKSPFNLPAPQQPRDPWRERLVAFGNLPGNYRALRATALMSRLDEAQSGIYSENHARHQQ